MKMSLRVLYLAFLSGCAAVTPIQKVLEMLSAMADKSEASKKDEEVKYAAFAQWCSDQTRVKDSEIKAATDRMAMLSALIEESEVRIRTLNDRVFELDADVSRWHSDAKSTAAVREKEAADFHATAQDYAETVDALGRAIEVLKKQSYDRPQDGASALVQLTKLKTLPPAVKKALAAFLQQSQPDDAAESMPDDQLFIKAPEANSYEFQSGGVIDMLAKLKVEFVTKKSELEAEELNAQHSFELISQQLADNVENAEHEISKKKVASAETAQRKADATGDLAQVTSDRVEDQKYLDDMTALCRVKKADFESRNKLREEEISAIRKAVEIISGHAVAGTAEAHLPTLLQKTARGQRRAPALALLRREPQGTADIQARIAAFLSERARGIDSKLLLLVSARVASNPFDKVKKMVKDLIVKLMEEASAETEHKGWCDAELATNKQKRDSLTEDVNKLSATVEDLTAEIARLSQEIADLATAIAEIQAQATDAAKQRADSKAKNEATIAEAKAAQGAVTTAIQILKDYYAKSGEATAFAQEEPTDANAGTPAADAPETFDKPYKGLIPEGGSVVDILEVILSDFSRLEAETATDEAAEQEQYEKYDFEMQKDKALKENEKGHKENRVTDKEGELHSEQAELRSTQEQLDAAMTYYEKLKPTCVDSGVTYEERAKRRQEEIQSLQEALKILSGEDI